MTNDDWEELRTYAINFVLDKTKAEIGGDADHDAAVQSLSQHWINETGHVEGYMAAFKQAVIQLILHGPN